MYRLQPLLFQPVPSEVGVPLTNLMQEVRAAYFPEIEGDIELRIEASTPLAYMAPHFMGRDAHLTAIHPVLNHPGTPLEVLRFIFKHELTHLVCPSRFIDGAWEHHPDEFWDHERAVGPEAPAAWAWINGNLGRCLHRTSGHLTVTAAWRRLRSTPRGPYTPSLPFKGERWERICPDAGAQLRLPASWVVRPFPLGRARPKPRGFGLLSAASQPRPLAPACAPAD
jgi:hypothetical protein